jgi:hypothetical protein
MAKLILGKKNKDGGITFFNIKICYNPIVAKPAQYWHKINKDQKKRIRTQK